MNVTQEGVNILALNIYDSIECRLLLSKIVLNNYESDDLYNYIRDLIDKKSGYPDYKHHM